MTIHAVTDRCWFVYTLTDPRDGRIRYVGWSFDVYRRVTVHCATAPHTNSHKGHWLQSVIASGHWPLVNIVESGFGDWAAAEIRWIAHFRALGCSLTNATNGGEGIPGFIMSIESRERMSRSHLGRKMSPESVAKTRAALLGRKQSPAHIALLSAARKGKCPTAATAAAALVNRGRKQSPEHIEKRIAPRRGRRCPKQEIFTDDQILAIRTERAMDGTPILKLAAKYRVGQTTIFGIIHRLTYTHVADALTVATRACQGELFSAFGAGVSSE